MIAQFFYGALRDPGLRAIVVGHGGTRLTPATLPGHAVRYGTTGGWPDLRAMPDTDLPGLLAFDLTHADVARLAHFCGGLGYDLRPVVVETADGPRMAATWCATPGQVQGLAQDGAAWTLDDWQARHAALARATADEAMQLFGHVAGDRLTRFWSMAESRAQARLAAATATDSALSGMARDDVALVAQRRPYQKFFAVAEFDLRLRQFDGQQGPLVERAVFLSADAALVLPYDPRRDVVLLVEQFRSGPYARGDAYPWCLEPIAGIIDGGETAETTARREALEEANLQIDRLIPIGAGYSSPGDSTNHFQMFCAPCDLPATAAGIGGLASEAENIRSHILPWAQFLALLDSGHLNVVPLQLMGHWLARHRDALRAGAQHSERTA